MNGDDEGIGLRWWRFAERVFVTPAVDQILAHSRGHYDGSSGNDGGPSAAYSDPGGVYLAIPYDDGSGQSGQSGRMVRCDAGRFL